MKDNLYELIHSLTKGEKRIVKIQALNNYYGQESKFLLLFDIYNNSAIYNKQKIADEIKRNQLDKHLTSTKTKLYNFILKCIHSSYTSHKKYYEIHELMDYSEILLQKNLIKQSKSMLIKASKIAASYHYLNEHKVILTKLRNLSLTEQNNTEIIEHIEETNPTILKINEQIQKVDTYQNLIYYSQFVLLKYFRLYSEHILSDATLLKKQITDHLPLNWEENNVIGYKPKFYQLVLKCNLLFIEGKLNDSVAVRKEIIAMLENNPHLILENPEEALYHFKMLIASFFILRKFDSVQNDIDRFTVLLASFDEQQYDKNTSLLIFNTMTMVKANYFINSRLFDAGCKFADEVLKNNATEINRMNTNNKQVFHFNMAYLYFGNGNYRSAMKQLNEILNKRNIHSRIDIQIYSRFFYMLIQLELNNYVLLESILNSTERYFKSENINKTEFDLLFLSFIKDCIVSSLSKTLLMNLKQKIEKIENKLYLDYFDFDSWIESKIT